MLPFTSLNAATALGAGATKDLEGIYANHFMVLSFTGSPSNIEVQLQGSHDGSTWITLADVSSGAGSPLSAAATGKAVRYIRASLLDLSGGSSPTMTATIASA